MTTQGGIVEYVKPGINLTMSAGGAIVGGNVVVLSGNRTVIASSAVAQAGVAGVALFNAASGDTNLTVATDGVWPLVAQGAIATGNDIVTGSVAGTAAALAVASTAVAADINNARNVFGRAHEAISNLATGRIKVAL